ncbi:MAG: metallophosphoesterase family protein [Zoogloea sp.]|uniref:metallophosphoesterase family protein n=1 Tax=Zoogloea sp. TaxID=49181 RepID=UPI0026199779|nr:metallophosphoesterase family protein [Zoogloea sp.]MDD2991561.1 metallophosphoesterase family protein [Zoogloea sp.]
MRRTALALALLVSLSALTAQAAEPFSFGVFGDTPYNRFERTHLPAVIAEMDAELLKVVIHDGDIKNGGERCDDALYEDRLSLFKGSYHPFVFVPGDNDWTDCHRPSNGAYDPLERLEKLRTVFFADPRKTHGQYPMAVDSQADNPAFSAYREHQRWQIGPVLFLTVNVPGSGNNFGRKKTPGAEYLARSAAVKAWIAAGFARARSARLEGIVLVMQANPDIEDFAEGKGNHAYRELLTQLLAETRSFPGQVLLVHGDSHVHRIDTPLRDPKDGSTVGNFTRVETFGSPFMGWVKVDVTPGSKPLFRPSGRPYAPKSGD